MIVLNLLVYKGKNVKEGKFFNISMARENVFASDNKGNRHIILNKEDNLIGRTEDNDIAIEDPFISRKHARIFKEDNKYYLVDLGSKNKTNLIYKGKREKIIDRGIELNKGDIIEIAYVPDKGGMRLEILDIL